jgi:hypothetical protein
VAALKADRRGTPVATLEVMLGSTRRMLVLSWLGMGLSGCSSDESFTVDVSGNYMIAITNGPNDCPDFKDWMEDKQTDGIGMVITQDGENLHGSLDGVPGALFMLAFGSAEFDGRAKGNEITLNNYGTRNLASGNCSYTYNATVKGRQSADSISGTITYASKTNGNPDCEAVECSATQEFSGSRPPK